MDSEAIVGIVIMLVCCWGSGALFLGIGICARKRRIPVHFWAGMKIDPSSISDISDYNRENGRMWMKYSIPYWISGALSILGAWKMWISVLSVVIMVLACTLGIVWLITTYKRIEKTYIVKI